MQTHRLRLSRFALEKNRLAACDNEELGGSGNIGAYRPAAKDEQPWRRRAPRAAAAAAAAALALVIAALVAPAAVQRCQSLRHRRRLAGVLHNTQPGAAAPGPAALRAGTADPLATAAAAATRAPNAAAVCASAAAAAALMQHQTSLLVEAGVYRPLPLPRGAEQGPTAWRCRSNGSPHSEPLPKLDSALTLRSAKPRPPGGGGITITTHLSLERLAALDRQSWPHPIAAAVYIPLLQGLRVASADSQALNGTWLDAALVPLLRLHRDLEAAAGSACQLDLEVVVERHCSAGAAALYPGNAVRNRALRMVQTEAVLLLDADFVVSASLAARMSDAAYRRQALALLQQPVALVLPAFEPTVARGGKAALLDECRAGEMEPFHRGWETKGHRLTDFQRWATTSHAYEVAFEAGFEPYILVHRRHLPWFDERLRGYFVNKVLHRAHMDSLGIRFTVHPAGFVVHTPHSAAASKAEAARQGLQERYNTLFHKALQDMEDGSYLPYVADPELCYFSVLPPEHAAA